MGRAHPSDSREVQARVFRQNDGRGVGSQRGNRGTPLQNGGEMPDHRDVDMLVTAGMLVAQSGRTAAI